MRRARFAIADLLRDVRHAVRLLARAPAFTLLAILTLGLGIGANTSIFTVVNALILRPLPYPSPDRLTFIDGTFHRPEGDTDFQLSYPEFIDLQDQARSFAVLAPWTTGYGLALEGTEGAARLRTNFVGKGYFDVLGATPMVGRTFTPDDHRIGDDGRMVVMVSEGVWRQHFGGDRAILGRDVRLQGRPFTVVGILPSTFDDAALAYSEGVDVWVPIERAPALVGNVDLTARGSRLMWGFARLADGVSLPAAQAELSAIGSRLAAAYPQTNASFELRAAPLADSFFRDARRPLWLLLGGSWFVLLIACANVANLLLVRSTARAREFAVRLAIGASRGRVVRQLLTESTVLAIAGAAAGLLMAGWMTPALVALSGLALPSFAEARLDREVLAVTVGTATVCGLLFGLAPVWRAFRMSLRGGVMTGSTHARRSGTALWLAGLEVTAAFVLTAGALTMLQSFAALTRTDLAFRSDRLLTVRLELPQERYATPAARARFGAALRDRAVALPGVEAAVLWGPSMFARSTWISFVAPTDRVVADSERVMLWRHSTNPGGLGDLGIALVAGRDFQSSDTLDTPTVAIVSEAAARRLWRGQDPIGRQLRSGSGATASILSVVGIAADARHRGRFRFSEGAAAREPQLDLYLAYAQRPNGLVTLGVRTAGAPSSAIKSVAAVIAAIDPALPAYDIAPLDDRLRYEEQSVGFASLLLNLYGGLALLLAAIGVYGVLAATVAARLRELGIRAALGAAPRQLQMAVVRQGLTVTLAAIAAGAGIAALLGSTTRALFFDASAMDPRVLAGAAALLLMAAATASFAPARRASRVDPVRVLKIE
jgi:putative ABC transport system permease protein